MNMPATLVDQAYSAAAIRSHPEAGARFELRVRQHFVEMPGLRLTAAQTARLCGLDPILARRVLEELVERGFLVRDARDRFRRRNGRDDASGSAVPGGQPMSEPVNVPQPAHRRPHPQSMAGTYLELDLNRELEQLLREPEWQSGHNARTLVKHDSLRVVLIAMKAQGRIPEHQTAGRITIQPIRGRIQVRADGRTFDLPAGMLLALDAGVRHDVRAGEDSAFLLTVAWPGRDDRPAA